MIDGSGGNHIAAGCPGPDRIIEYAEQVGADWRTTQFDPPTDRAEYGPQLAVQGNVLYLAYTRIRVEEPGCSDSGIRDDGVYLRTRTLTSATWSEAGRIGELADHLQSFRVTAGTIHATVSNADDGLTYYETVQGDTTHRYRIPRAEGEVALRVGGDGKARIAYEADQALWYGVFTGTGFSSTEIPGTRKGSGNSNAFGPTLVLGGGDRPYLLWRHGFHGGCSYPDDEPRMGTYFGTQVGGRWQTERLSQSWGLASLTIDVATGDLHAVINDKDGLMYLNKPSGGAWARERLDDTGVQDAVIRRDARTGALLVAYLRYEEDRVQIYVIQGR